jgi:succinate dehydrogenase / fumarate reductase, cytochrome b subunit
MTFAQLVFLAGLTVALLAVVWFGVVVVADAARSDGGPRPGVGLLGRLERPRTDWREANRWAFYVHRLTGCAIFAFLCLHIVDVSTYAFSRDLYGEVHDLYGSTPMRVFECALLFAILFHALNGLRIIAVDVADLGMVPARRALVAVMALTLLAGTAGSAVILAPVLA